MGIARLKKASPLTARTLYRDTLPLLRRVMQCVVLGLSLASLAVAEDLPPEELMRVKGCIGCHRIDEKLVGPAYKAVADRYRADKEAPLMLQETVRNGGEGNWGDMPMPANTVEKISDADLKRIVEWILGL